MVQNLQDFISNINSFAVNVSQICNKILCFNVLFWQNDIQMPFLIAFLLFSSIYFFAIFGFVNFKFMAYAIRTFFSSKLNSYQEKMVKTLGSQYQTSRKIVFFVAGGGIDLGSIFGVSAIVSFAGLGTIFWMLIISVLSSSVRFAEVFAAHYFRTTDEKAKSVFGGPQIYIKKAFEMINMPMLGKFMALVFSLALGLSTFCSLQVNQTVMIITHFVPQTQPYTLFISIAISAIILSLLTLSFKTITNISSVVVPLMARVYIASTVIIILFNFHNIAPTINEIFSDALSLKSGFAGILATIVVATQRTFFCNETGMGSGAISHANSINKDSILEGIISTITPVVSIAIICVCSGFIAGITGAFRESTDGIYIIMKSFATVHEYFPILLIVVVPLFGVTTAVAWAYYGQRVWIGIFGAKTLIVYNVLLFLAYCVSGSVSDFTVILNIADILGLAIAIPNIISLIVLSRFIVKKLRARYAQKNMMDFDEKSLDSFTQSVE